MSEFTVKPASRQGIIPLIGLWGGTGGGKSHTALLLARGLAGNGKVAGVDTEHKRLSYYTDKIPGGFSVIDFTEPYTPERYLSALDLLEQSCDVGVLDSASHLWAGPDGILDLHEQVLDKIAGDDYGKRSALNWPAWREPKMRFAKVRDRILRFKIPLICCFRGEEKTHLVKNDKGRNEVVTDTATSPIFDKKFIFEFHIAVECVQIDGKGGYIRFPRPHAKVSHEDIRKILPEAEKDQISAAHGAALKKWCDNPGAVQTPKEPSQPAVKPSGKIATEATKVWFLKELAPYGHDAIRYAIEQAIILPTEGLDAWPLESVPTSKAALGELCLAIDSWRGA